MSPRSNRPSKRSSRRPAPRGVEPEETAELSLDRILGSMARTESGADGAWTVRTVTSTEKTYRCPGCQQLIAKGTSHVVAWQQEGLFGAEAALADRRHWHQACWKARGRRR